MRTSEETAKYMIERYGKDAEIHLLYTLMQTDENGRLYWNEVGKELKRLRKESVN